MCDTNYISRSREEIREGGKRGGLEKEELIELSKFKHVRRKTFKNVAYFGSPALVFCALGIHF